jgi:alpha-L-fucosidase
MAAHNQAHRTTARGGLPLPNLQQPFVDLRFGMLLHSTWLHFRTANGAIPPSPPNLFHPTALDRDQWAAAAQSANKTWACLTTRHHDGFCTWPAKTAGSDVPALSCVTLSSGL